MLSAPPQVLLEVDCSLDSRYIDTRILSSRAEQTISLWPPLNTTPHKVEKPSLRVTVRDLPQSDRPCLAEIANNRALCQAVRCSVFILLIKERYTVCSVMPVSILINPLSADDCVERLELSGGVGVGINKFLTYSSPQSPRVPCSVASRLTHPLIETSFGLRRRHVVATDRVVFISQFPCL